MAKKPRRHNEWLVRMEGDGNNALSVHSRNETFPTEKAAWNHIEHMKKKYPNENIDYYIAHLEKASVRQAKLPLKFTAGPDGLDF